MKNYVNFFTLEKRKLKWYSFMRTKQMQSRKFNNTGKIQGQIRILKSTKLKVAIIQIDD